MKNILHRKMSDEDIRKELEEYLDAHRSILAKMEEERKIQKEGNEMYVTHREMALWNRKFEETFKKMANDSRDTALQHEAKAAEKMALVREIEIKIEAYEVAAKTQEDLAMKSAFDFSHLKKN